MNTAARIALVALACILALAACGSPTPLAPTLAPPPTVSPTVISEPATSTAAPLQGTPTRSAAEITNELGTFLESFQKTVRFSGVVLVARNGEVLYQQGFGETTSSPKSLLTPTSKFRIASVTKQFTAAAILKLQAQGKLDVQDKVCKYLKACPESWQNITIHHLLTHSSGIDAAKIPDADNFYRKFHTPQELIAQFQQLPLDFEPGDRFSYGNAGYTVLSALVEQQSGKPYEAFLREQFFDPLGLQDTGGTIEDSQLAGEPFSEDLSNDVGAGTLYSSVQDLNRWAQALDKWQSDPKSEYQAMFQPQIVSDDCGVGRSYGYGLCIGTRFDQAAIGHFGGSSNYTSVLMRYPASGVTIIILSNTDREQDVLESAIAKIVLGAK